MNDTRDLLSEAVGSYEPRGDERAVERRVERRERRRRISSGVVGLGVFVAAGWLAWTAFGPGTTAGSGGAGTYLVSEFRVQAHVDPATGDAAPGQADVSFATGWSTDRYPGVHACRVRVVGPTGAVIGSRSLDVSSLSPDGVRTAVVPVGGPIAGATATGSCSQRRLDSPVAAGVSDERFEYVDGHLSVVFEVHVPEGTRVSAQACTSAVWSGDGRAARERLVHLHPLRGDAPRGAWRRRGDGTGGGGGGDRDLRPVRPGARVPRARGAGPGVVVRVGRNVQIRVEAAGSASVPAGTP